MQWAKASTVECHWPRTSLSTWKRFETFFQELVHISRQVCLWQRDRTTEGMTDMWRNVIYLSYTLGCEYRVMRNRYSRLLFTSEDRICANLRVQEQSTNMTSQCYYISFAWRHRTTVVTSQCPVRKDRPWRHLRYERSMKSLANRLTRDPKIVIHGNSCIILYIFCPAL